MVTDFPSAPFLQMGCAKQAAKNYMKLQYNSANPTISIVSDDKVVVESIKNGIRQKSNYSVHGEMLIAISADANTEIVIYGNITELNCDSDKKLVALSVENNEELKVLSCFKGRLTSLDLTNNANLIELNCKYNLLTSLDLSNNTKLTALNCFDNQITILNLSVCTELSQMFNLPITIDIIYYPATNSSVSARIANHISSANTSADGTVYTDSAGAYYQTIADAATAKGWTIEQLS